MRDEELRDEAEELLNRLRGSIETMRVRDRDFAESMVDRFEEYGDLTRVTHQQIFWLRDLVERYGA